MSCSLPADDTEAALARVVQAVRRYAPLPIGIQLSHAGRKGSMTPPWDGGRQIRPEHGGWRSLSASALPHTEGDMPPLAMDHDGLGRIRDAFAAAARRAHRLGLDLIEVHAAHGYLLHQFLSPLSNRREDEYGGSSANRMRFPLEVFDAVRAAVPSRMPVGVRISATDWVDGGWDLEQSVDFARTLKQRGCSFIHVSSGGLSTAQRIPLEPGYQLPFADRIREETGMFTIAVGLITEASQAEAAIAAGRADMVALARGMLYDPRWPWHAAAELGAQVDAPKQYWRCQPVGRDGLFKT